ncbi:MAG TPA: RNA-binding domain-containing protein, partial [Micropepsaceae bacterium]|nr:RNA-binding domain-containing protein [Micropepsaceae bacterium]
MIRLQPLSKLMQELNQTDECEDLEAKRSEEVGKSTLESICSLSNEPDLGGGTILLGVEKEAALFTIYKVTGVRDPERIASDISSACASQFNQPVRVDVRPEQFEGKTVLKVDVPELPKTQKPLYFKATGLPRGAYRRIGPTDVRCTDEDLLTFYHGKVTDVFDARIINDAGWDDIDPEAIDAYRKARGEANPHAEELRWSDQDMLHSLGAINRIEGKQCITATGILMFGKAMALRRLFPTLRVDYIRIPT